MIRSRPTSAPQQNKYNWQCHRFGLLTGAGMSRLFILGLLVQLMIFPVNALAHPLDEFYQVTYITVAPNRVTLKIELYPGILVAPQLLTTIDSDQNDDISTAEAQAYVTQFIDDLIFEIDNQATPLQATNLDFPPVLGIRAGQAIIRFDLHADLSDDLIGSHQLFYQNNHQPDTGVYVVNAIAETPDLIQITGQDRDLFQSSIKLDYTIEAEAPPQIETGEAQPVVEPSGGISSGQEQLNRWFFGSFRRSHKM